MDHPCHRCRASVEDGVAFCPQCGAPQIRVSTASVPEPPVTPALPPGTLGEPQPTAQLIGLPPGQPAAIEWSQGLRAAALAGLLLALAILFVPVIAAGIGLSLHLGQGAIGLLVLLVSWCCILGAGGVAVRFYRRRRPQVPIYPGMGARLGAVCGLLGFFFYSVPQVLRLVFFHFGGSVREAMRKAIEQSAAQSPDPKAQEMMRNLMSPGALAALITVLVVLFFLSFLVLSTVGGAIAASWWRRNQSS